MALVNITFGKRAQSSDVNQIVGLLKGTAGYGDSVLLTQYSSASNPALTLLNLNTTSGKALVVRNPENTRDILSVQRKGGGDIVAINRTAYPPPNGTDTSFGVYHEQSSGSHVMADFIFDSTAPATSDSGAMRAVARQLTTGSTSLRAGEFQVLRGSTASANGTWGIEIGVHSQVAGSAPNSNVGIYLASSHSGWLSTGVRNDTGILIGGEDGWKDALRNYHTDGATVLHRMCNFTSGDDLIGDFMAVGRIYTTGMGGTRVGWLSAGGAPAPQTWAGGWYDAVNLGFTLSALTGGTAWRPLFLAPSGGGVTVGAATAPLTTLHVAGTVGAAAGTAALPSHTFTGDLDTGWSAQTANTLVGSSAGTQRLMLDATGNVVVGTAALATTATDGFLYLDTCAGTPTGAPTSYTGRVPMVVDTSGSKIYVNIGGTWKSVAVA